MNNCTITTDFKIENYTSFKEWFDDYNKNVIEPFSELRLPYTEDSGSFINASIEEINKNIKEKWDYFGCSVPIIKNIEIEIQVKK